MHKTAYPNEEYFTVPGQYDTDKWLKAMKQIVAFEKNGYSKRAAIQETTKSWKELETLDFLRWVHFYEEGNHLKYKTANWQDALQNVENFGTQYYMPLPLKQEDKKPAQVKDHFEADDDEMHPSLKKKLIFKQKEKIISRLDSAEKMLRAPEGQLFAGKEYQEIIEIIYELKKKIHMINKSARSSKTYEDMIIREANKLDHYGFVKGASLLHSIAEEVAKDETKEDAVPESGPPPSNPASPNPVTNGGAAGVPGTLPSTGPATNSGTDNNTPNLAAPPPQATSTTSTAPATSTPTPPIKAPAPGTVSTTSTEPQKSAPVKQFIDGLSGKKPGQPDANTVEDDENNGEDKQYILELTAQEVPPPPPPPPPASLDAPPAKPAVKPEVVVEVSEKFDDKFDQIFAGLKINDVIEKLEELSKIFKVREIPRQLSIIDMMLDRLGLSTYFPALAEATNKALESNNYISTRIDEVLSKLRGSLPVEHLDLTKENSPTSEEVMQVKEELQQDQDNAKAKKDMKKKMEDEALEAQMAPEIEVQEDLSKPLETPAPPAAPPPPPPAAPPPVKK